MSRSTPPHHHDNSPEQQPPSGPELLRGRTALVLLLSALCGIAATILWRMAGHPWPDAVLAGGAATGGALGLFQQLIGTQW
ncbi:hypothetical protein ACFYNX_10570 [Streptomyces sp. NPDC007872]|uniref:hypothetical protein n=1 Tax=Streptomyces sp. NPDC007872 TaxID=3364782 RepID=UPI00368F9748